MKIRIKGNSIRFRLTKTEVHTFCETGFFSDQTVFNSSIFSYALQAKKGITTLEADFSNDCITLFLPYKEKETWAESSNVGFNATFELDSGKALSLLVEKDFTCLDNRDEDQSDNYPNPLKKDSTT